MAYVFSFSLCILIIFFISISKGRSQLINCQFVGLVWFAVMFLIRRRTFVVGFTSDSNFAIAAMVCVLFFNQHCYILFLPWDQTAVSLCFLKFKPSPKCFLQAVNHASWIFDKHWAIVYKRESNCTAAYTGNHLNLSCMCIHLLFETFEPSFFKCV